MKHRVEHIGDATLYLGDCLEILPTLDKVDAVVTDPPYGIKSNSGKGKEGRSGIKGNYDASFDDTIEYVETVCVEAIRMCLTIAQRVAVTPGRLNIQYYPQARDIGIFYQPAATGCSSWGRPTWQPILFYGSAPHNGEQLRPLHHVLTEHAPKNGHPCPKPLRAWEWLLNKTTKADEIILDPFMGSGTTGVICAKLGRKFIGIELSEKYFDLACKLIEEECKHGKLDLSANDTGEKP